MSDDSLIEQTIEKLVFANRILAREDVIDDFGHISARHPVDPNRYFLSRSRSPELVGRDDILEFNLDGSPVSDLGGRRAYAERPIHGAIYSSRPDVNAVSHHHARSVLPFAVTGQPLRPVFHMGSVIGSVVPLWDSQDEFGDTAMIVDTWEMGVSLAKALGDNVCALLARHGAVTTGARIEECVFASVYMKETAEILLRSLPLGEPSYLSDGEIEKTCALLRSPLAQERAWSYYLKRAGFEGL